MADLQQQVDTLMDEAIIRSWESNAQEGEWMAREKDMRGLICSLYSIIQIQESGLVQTSSVTAAVSAKYLRVYSCVRRDACRCRTRCRSRGGGGALAVYGRDLPERSSASVSFIAGLVYGEFRL